MQKTTLVVLFSFFTFLFTHATNKTKPIVADPVFDVTVSLIGEVLVEYHAYDVYNTYEWQFEYGPAGFKPGEGITKTFSGINFYRFTLDPLRKYDFRVRERRLQGTVFLWGNWSDTKTVQGSSDKVFSVGYATNFNDKNTTNLEWRGLIYNNSSSIATVSLTTYKNHSENNAAGSSMMMASYNYDDKSHIGLISPRFNDLATDRKIKFWVNGNYNSDTELLVGTMSDPNDKNTFHLLQKIEPKSGLEWRQETVYLTNYNGTDQYVVFFFKRGYYGSNGTSLYIDDFSYEKASDCFDQTNFAVSNVQQNSAQISFDAPNQNNFQVSLTNIVKKTTEIFTIKSSSFTLDKLVGNTDYEVKVRANCIDDLFSNWTKTISFKTPCTVITDRYSTSFEGTKYIDPCWSVIAGKCLIQSSLEDTGWARKPAPKTGTTTIVMSKFVGALNVDKAYLVTPYIADLDSDKRIRFSLLAYSSDDEYNKTSLTIGTMSDPKNAATFVALKTILPSEMNETENEYKSSLWKEHTVYLDNYVKSNNHNYIALRYNNESDSYFSIDDFTYEKTPVCLEPLNPKTISLGYDSATVSWENYKPASQFQIEYGPKGFAHGSGKIVDAAAIPFKLESLQDDTDFDFYVRAKCGSEYSAWSDRGNFKTKCLGLTAGYTENFENTVFEKNGCWTRIVPYIYQRYYRKDRFVNINTITNNSSTVHNGSQSVLLSSQLDLVYPPGTGEKTDRVVLVSPRFKDFDNYKKINFWMQVPKDSDDLSVELIIGTLSDPEDYSTFKAYKTIVVPVANKAKWLNYDVDFSNYFGTDKYIGFKQKISNHRSTRFFIDDFQYIQNNCPIPGVLGARQSGPDSVLLDWKDNNTLKPSQSFDIEYGSKGFVSGSGTIIKVTENPYNLAGLARGTYEYRVRAYCDTNITSDWSDRYTFKTSCSKTAPFVEDFDEHGRNLDQSTTFCWSYNIQLYAQLAEFNLTNITSAPYAFALYTNKDSAMLISPYLDDFDKNKKVKFWLRGSQTGSSRAGTLIVGTIKNAADLSTFEPYLTITEQEINSLPLYGKEVNIDFSQYQGANKQIVFKYMAESTNGDYVRNTLLIDDFRYDQTSACYEPIDIVFSDINHNSTLISWTSKNQATENVQIEYGLTGFTKGTGTIVITKKNEILISKLQTGTSYEFYFKTTCASGNSLEAGPRKIETTCEALALPWKEKFTNLSRYGTNVLPDCFKFLRGELILENTAQDDLNYRFSPDYKRSGFDDTGYLYLNGGFWTQIMTPMFYLNAGTTYKFNLKGRNSYEYRIQGVGLYVGKGQNDYNMSLNISQTGNNDRLTEYNYRDVSYYFTPLVSGDYSFLMEFANTGGSRLLVDDFELKEGYTSSIDGSGKTITYDFTKMPSGELIFEGGNKRIVLDSNNNILVMKGNGTPSEWKNVNGTSQIKKGAAVENSSVWERNESSIAKINTKVNAANASSLFMHFDLKQTFVSSNTESMFRVVVNGNVVGDVIKPESASGDDYKKYTVDLTPYVGADIRMSLQHIGKSEAGDNAYLDNLVFDKTSSLGVDGTHFSNFKYYPNPVENVLHIESNSVLSKVEVYTLSGQLLSINNYSDSKVSIDFKNHTSGVYLLVVTQDDKKETFKVIKK
ncbi:T9SS-dependent choice-of-anchor J family protein [Flavobacterium sp. N502536]|uniref:T9SS-dependent choice-of-anchor J family protein n=1 Tax=Flavobacterium sp. N502536 TaxID=2986837 RepID=UPI002222B1CC|nr:choice-of-anchor J domain-containing protein [Flavobacterium sp. N502536]